MPDAYYIIPMVSGPYSSTNHQRPDYVDEIRCNWTGHNVDALGVYVCKVNTTEAKHTDLAGRAGVRQMPRGYTWETVISTMPTAARNSIRNWLTGKGLPYDATETIGQCLMRIINSGLFEFGAAGLDTQYQNLTQAQQNKIIAVCNKWNIAAPTDTETVRSITDRFGPIVWPGNSLNITEY